MRSPVPDPSRAASIQVKLLFPTLKAAREASKYVDREGYKVRVERHPSRAMLIAGFHGSGTGTGAEEYAFEPLADRFGGKMDGVETRSYAP